MAAFLGFLSQYALFLAEVLTVVLAVAFIVARVASAVSGSRRSEARGHLRTRRLDMKFRRLGLGIQREVMSAKAFKQLEKEQSQLDKARDKAEATRPCVYVLDFNGDIRASQVSSLRDEVTAVITAARPGDEVVVRLESPGGLVHSYGLAASQLARFREKKLPLTVVVDKIAASGGYMMACVADRIVAAPFAVLGSIGVVAQVPNVNRLLKKHDIDYEIVTAGPWKRTLTVFGENTEAGREKFRQEIEETHNLFKDFVHLHRPALDMEAVATGEHWYGTRALELGLCDEIRTSDDWLLARAPTADLLEVKVTTARSVGDRLGRLGAALLDRVVGKIQQSSMEPRG